MGKIRRRWFSSLAVLSAAVLAGTLGVDPAFAAVAEPASLFTELTPRSSVPPLESERLR